MFNSKPVLMWCCDSQDIFHDKFWLIDVINCHTNHQNLCFSWKHHVKSHHNSRQENTSLGLLHWCLAFPELNGNQNADSTYSWKKQLGFQLNCWHSCCGPTFPEKEQIIFNTPCFFGLLNSPRRPQGDLLNHHLLGKNPRKIGVNHPFLPENILPPMLCCEMTIEDQWCEQKPAGSLIVRRWKMMVGSWKTSLSL